MSWHQYSAGDADATGSLQTIAGDADATGSLQTIAGDADALVRGRFGTNRMTMLCIETTRPASLCAAGTLSAEATRKPVA